MIDTRGRPRIAIVSAAGLLPGAAGLSSYWANLRDGIDASADSPPPGRWAIPPEVAYSPKVGAVDAVYSTRGYFLDAVPLAVDGLHLPADWLSALDPSVHLAVHLTRSAWSGARVEAVDPRRVGVMLGHIALPTDRVSELADEVLGPLLTTGRAGAPRLAENHYVAGWPAMVAARALGLGGPAFTLDAACASSLYAIKLACDALQEHRVDAAIAGGLSRPDCLYTQMGFSQLRALSPSGRCSPFDAAADGLVVGEGGGAFVLKRLADAVAAGDRILGVIAGVVLSNDREGNLLAPASEGQLRALRPAYEQAGWSPGDVDLIECHATGTPVGDATEFRSLRLLWQGAAGRCVLGSAKANVGHLLTGAGAAGLLKVLLAMEHRVLPPTPNFRHAGRGIDLVGSPFCVLQAAEDWHVTDGRPRRAAVDGFGFGGINAHLLVEEYLETRPASIAVPPAPRPLRIAIVGVGRREVTSGDDVAIPLGRFAVPPCELEAMLPQQALMLLAAADAVDDAGTDALVDPSQTGAYIGVSLDPNTTNFHYRWTQSGEIRDAVSPPLTADRTMGALASIAASRVARALELGGPSFTLSSEETSGVTALDSAARALARGEIRAAVVGAVDLTSDVRTTACLPDGTPTGNIAVAFVLERLDDAERSGRSVHAVIDGIALGDNPSRLLRDCIAEAQIDDRQVGLCGVHAGIAEDKPLIDNLRKHLTTPAVLHDSRAAAGYAGAACAMVALADAVAALRLQRLPAGERRDGFRANGEQFWLLDRAIGPRAALVVACSRNDCAAVMMTEAPGVNAAATDNSVQPLDALFFLDGDSPEAVHSEVARLAAWCAGEPSNSVQELARSWWRNVRPRPGRRFGAAVVARDRGDLEASLRGEAGDNFFESTAPLGIDGQVAFVYPGSGNHYAGMGRELGLAFSGVLRRHQRENRRLKSQWRPELFWDDAVGPIAGRDALFGQVCFGTLISDLLGEFGVVPDLALGNSLGTSASLFGTRAWTGRDEMLRRLECSSLFTEDLAGPMRAAQVAWRLPPGGAVDWLTAVAPASPERIRHLLPRFPRVYLLTINAPDECTVGGERSQVMALAEAMGSTLLPLSGVTAAHCEVVGPVADEYRELHRMPTVAPAGIRFMHQVSCDLFRPSRDTAAEAILAQASHTVDFPAIVNAAYEAGARVFVEIGPGSSCARMISQILEGRTHAVRSCSVARDEVGSFVRVLAMLHSERVHVDLSPLYGQAEPEVVVEKTNMIRLPVRSSPFETDESPRPICEPSEIFVATATARLAESRAHAEYLRIAAATDRGMQSLLAFQGQCLVRLAQAPTPSELFMDRDACLAFAVGRVGPVLGENFVEIDTFPTRVRLPDEPLMLVDRIAMIEGEPLSLTQGRVVTEHDVLVDDWYLDHGRVPVCIAVESGQADLFLSGYLGIDLRTRGLAVYRLLDAVVTFHRELPGPGRVIRYDINIDRFFRQGDTHLFRFRFEATVDGEPLMSMSDGCAGFFTEAELAGGKGIVHTELDRRPMPGTRPEEWRPFAPVHGVESYDDAQLDALRRGDLTACFGQTFAGLSLREPMRLPGGRMRLVHRVSHLDPTGGRFGLGLVRGEADVHPDDWYLTCHFVDDQVMPGTLMYECCLHTLRVYLMRLGWVGEHDDVAWQPIPGVPGRLKCRGQVIATTAKVEYEVSVKEIGYRPEPYAIADVLMYADGKPIVEMLNMSVRLSGTDEAKLADLWKGSRFAQPQPARPKRPALYDTDRILAFAVGKPSEAFGERYRVFDSERVIARLPGPPYQFLDRIVAVTGEPWAMNAGALVEAEYDVPADAWYYDANRRPAMPFAVLLEIALQPCGWLAAYMGSALTSDVDLSFRNLGGKAKQHRAVPPDIGTLTTAVKSTRVSSSGGMIIQHYEFAVSDGLRRPVYDGTTYFGFFSKAALANQVGIREAEPFVERAVGERFAFPRSSPYPDQILSMVDEIVQSVDAGGPHGLGYVRGVKTVRADEWFFKAHFHQDPVMPGSLGLEAFLQLLYTTADRRWGPSDWQTVASGTAHEWVYRGQVIPTDRQVTVQAELTKIDDANRLITANGYLSVDGRVIYRMTDFTLQG